MKVIILNSHDIKGGAARAAYRLHNALQGIGVESKMFVQYKNSNDYTVFGPANFLERIISIFRPRLENLPVMLYKKRSASIFSSAFIPASTLIKKINSSDADVVHLQWIANGMLRIEDLARISKPIIWTLHDMWALTGGCHYDNGCCKYINECCSCPNLASTQKNDLSARVFRRKKRIFSRLKNMTVVGVSSWLADSAKKSALLRDKTIFNIPNPIDINIYKPLDKAVARDMLGFAPRKKIILFGALDYTTDQRKGFSELSQALHKIKSNDIELGVFGAGRPQNEPDFGFPVKYLGMLYDDLTLRVAYSAADVMVVPSLQEAFGQTASEAMACGTPVVAFGTTGLLDIVEHKKNGYLAKTFDTDDLAQGIDWVLSHPDQNLLSQNARKKVLDNFEASKVASQYLELYEKILGRKVESNEELHEI